MSGLPGRRDLPALHEAPRHLLERVRPKDVTRSPVDGALVLYWMHHAVRGHENPALDLARHAAASLDRPLLVYQGLGGAHPYDSDRHHTFILEGARDAQAELGALGVRHVFNLGSGPGPGAGSALVSLARRAALVVTEDMPVPPLGGWTRRLAERIAAPVWRVDTACVAPMASLGRRFDRAFAFRRAAAAAHAERVTLPWPQTAPACAAFDGLLGFEPLDVASMDVAEVCAGCSIDHGVAPAPGTVGGARAGYARWDAFLRDGLSRYARDRNDPSIEPPRGVSRLSAYLHHGHVSAFRIAREAAADGSDGARKFLDELLVWRELAYGFCLHHEHRLAGDAFYALLPEWAREALEAAARDAPREAMPLERLERAASGEALWDLAQRSLLVHGELHNNVRMTWGKALLGWSRDGRQALERMVELNHRYALDASDPNSYAGLGYCLGLFDRPFASGDAVFGAVRTRPVSEHAARVNLAAYGRRVGRRAGTGAPSALVVGAGVAGLSAARALSEAGIAVRVLDRGKRAGGRLATRRAGEARFDHGCVAFEARDARFARHAHGWVEAGVAAWWEPRVVPVTGADGRTPRLVGVPGASALAAHLAQGLALQTEAQVSGVERRCGEWTALGADGAVIARADALVLAMPPEQALRLLAPDEPVSARLSGVRSGACWAALAVLAEPAPTTLDEIVVEHHALALAVRESSKPGRAPGQHWVLHATPRWSAERMNAERDAVAAALLGAFGEVLGFDPAAPVFLAGHRWGLARASAEVAGEVLWDDGRRLAVCGDWCAGGDLAGAFLSGRAAAGRIAGRARDYQGISDPSQA